MGNKNIAIGTVIILFSIVTVALASETFDYSRLNPAATIAAIAVAVIGIAWLKRTAKLV